METLVAVNLVVQTDDRMVAMKVFRQVDEMVVETVVVKVYYPVVVMVRQMVA